MSLGDAAEKAAQKVGLGGLLVDGGRKKRFGVGDPTKEQSCAGFKAFVECVGYLQPVKKSLELPPGSTVRGARNSFEQATGYPVRQTRILDEDGYELDPATPVWHHSNGCNIALALNYDTVVTRAVGMAAVAKEGAGRAWQVARSWLRTET